MNGISRKEENYWRKVSPKYEKMTAENKEKKSQKIPMKKTKTFLAEKEKGDKEFLQTMT